MEWEIEELLRRRTDLSTFVIHWTRQGNGKTALENLQSILADQTLYARTPMGAAVIQLQKIFRDGKLTQRDYQTATDSQRVVCFTEAPLEQAWSFVCHIKGRQKQLEPFGLAFTKPKAREHDVNPVWYVDETPGRDWLTKDVWELVRQAAEGERFSDQPIANIAPFVEGMGTWRNTKKEFWWEREWRHRGNFGFFLENVAVVFCPQEHRKTLGPYVKGESGRIVPIIDPNWGQEEIIASLSGVWG